MTHESACGYGCGNTSRGLYCLFYWLALIAIILAILLSIFCGCGGFFTDCDGDRDGLFGGNLAHSAVFWLFLAAIAFSLLALNVWGGYTDAKAYAHSVKRF